MDLQRERKIADLCRDAMDLPSGEVTPWLRQQCAGDDDLFQEVQEYLVAMGTSQTDFMGGLYSLPKGQADWSEQAMKNKVIGSYEILAKLGEGGMGSVFLAQQTEPLTRKVALKIVKRIRDPSRKKKISAEVQAMALLSHPHLTQVYEVGHTEEGHLFFAMEYVPGETLNHYCDQRRLPLEDRLWLLIHVCRGVQHAHEEKILHRDLKPSNILVAEIDGKPVPKIIDFGTVQTQSRPEFDDLSMLDRAGTPTYMSPEALQVTEPLVLDARTDVYALGIILFELISGLRPFPPEEAGLTHILKQAANTDLPSPSSRFKTIEKARQETLAQARGQSAENLLQQLEGQLDTITAKACARNREDRYASVAALATDLERHLRGQVHALAKPPHPFKRLRRWQPGPLFFILGWVTLVLAGGWLWQNTQLKQTHRSQVRLEQQTEFLTRLIEQQTPGLIMADMLEKGRQWIGGESVGDPIVRADLCHLLGTAYLGREEFNQAQPLLEQALALRQTHLAPDHQKTGASLLSLGQLHSQHGPLDQALDYLTQAQPLISSENGDRFYTWVYTKATVYGSLSRYAAREALLTDALTRIEEQGGDNHSDLSRLLALLGTHYNELGQFGEATEVLARAIDIDATMEAWPTLARSLTELGKALSGQGSADAAVILEASAESFGELVSRRRLEALLALSQDHLDHEELNRAQAVLAACQSLLGDLGTKAEAATIAYQATLARSLRMRGHLGIAENHAAQALELAQRQFGEHVASARPLHQLGKIQLARNCLAEALVLFKRELDVLEKHMPNRPDRVLCLAEMAEVYLRLGQRDDAQHYLQRARLLRQRFCEPQSRPFRRVSEVVAALP